MTGQPTPSSDPPPERPPDGGHGRDEPDLHAVGELFAAALELPAAGREAWLEEACPDPAIRAEVRSLLEHDRASDDEAFLRSPVIRPSGPEDAAPAAEAEDGRERARTVGGYRLVRVLGRGGMGTVHEAVQERPARPVALKILRSDLAAPSLLRRFEHEAELLARLDHPGIAHVYEAGIEPAAPGGSGDGPRPWFAMELVRGRRLDAWAAAEHPSLEERLELLARVCDALQHAHQKGIVHRDVKPANVLVTEEGRPKLVDFGVARALEAELRPTGIDTGTGRMVGTLAYMSPEQVAGDPRAIDARSDVYAAGVLAYELLVGRLPHDTTEASLADTVRAIEAEVPPRPGTIVPALRGDVETVLLRALEKDPERRYPAASELAADLRRAARGEPVAARPPSALRQLRALARRHRAATAATGVAAAAVLLALVSVSVLALRLDAALEEAELRRRVAERESARTGAVGAFLERTLSAPDPFSNEPATPETTVDELLSRAEAWLAEDAFAAEPLAEAAARAVLARTWKGLGRFEEAEAEIRRALARLDAADAADLVAGDTRRRAALHAEHAVVLAYLEREEEAAAALARSERIAATVPGTPPADAAARLGNVGFVLRRLGREEEAERAIRAAIDAAEAMGPAGRRPRATSSSNLAGLLAGQGRHEEAMELYAVAHDLYLELDGEDHPNLQLMGGNLAVLAIRTGDFAEAARRLERVVASLDRTVGPAHPRTLVQRNNLAYAQHEIGALEAADATYRRALAGTEEAFGRGHPEYRSTLRNHAFLVSDLGPDAAAAAAWAAVAEAYRAAGTREETRLATIYAAYAAEHRVAAAAEEDEDPAALDRALAGARETLAEVAGAWGPDADVTRRVAAGLRARLEAIGRPGAIPEADAAAGEGG